MRALLRTIRGRLVLGFGLTILVLSAAGVLAIQALSAVGRDVARDVGRSTEIGNRLFQTHDATLRLVALAQAELMAGRATRTRAIDSLSVLSDSLRRQLVTEAELTTGERERIEELGNLQSRIEVRLAVARAYRDIDRIEDAFRQAALATATLDTLFTESAALTRGQEARTRSALSRIEELVGARRAWLIVLLAMGLAIALGFGRMTWQAIAGPLGQLMTAARALGRGDLSAHVSVDGMAQEYRVLGSAFTNTVDRLREMLTAIDREAENVDGAAKALAGASEQSAASTGEISTVMTEIAQDAETQREHLGASDRVLQDVRGAADQLDETARRSEAAGSSIRETAERTREGVGQAVESLETAESVIRESARAVTRLREASARIGKLVDTIAAIAHQTKLLALNASIEAARAGGETGRGFAVVAQEIRTLSADSTTAVEEVRAVVESMREEIDAAAESFESGVAGLGDVGTVSRQTAQALEAIEGAVPQVGEVAAAVVEAARTSRSAVESLGEHLGAAGEGAESQAAASQEAAAAAQETAATAEELTATAKELQSSAERLNALVARFSFDEDEPSG